VFCESDQHRLQFGLNQLNSDKMAASSIGKNREQYGGWGTTVMLRLVKNSSVKEEV
jgi:hypothetical protein